MPTQSPGVFLVIGFSVLGATLLLYVLVRLVEQCHRLSLRLCRPQYEWLHGEARRCCCCHRHRAVKEIPAGDFERDDGTLCELQSSESDDGTGGGVDDGEDEDKEARRYQAARHQALQARQD
jgi:hypothetical protein